MSQTSKLLVWARARAHPVRTMRRCLLEICLRAIPSCLLPSTCISSVSGMRCCAGSIADACRSGLGFGRRDKQGEG